MDALFTLITSLASTLSGPAAGQWAQVVNLIISALPGIEAGVVSAEPFVKSAFDVLLNGGKPVDATQWAAQMELLKAQMSAVDAQVVQDAKDQPE